MTMDYKKPTDVIGAMINSGISKINLDAKHLLIRSVLSGALLGIGTSLAFTASSQTGLGIVGALLFPSCFVIVILLGLELVTGSFAVLPVAYFDKKIGFWEMGKNLLTVYLGNLIGGVLYAFLFWISMTNFGHTAGSPVAAAIMKAAEGKTLGYAKYGVDGTVTVFTKAILCNWMVTMAVVMGFTSTSASGKIIGAWLPITIFFAQGYEHAVVNMFLIPAGMMLGAKISVSDWWLYNQIPVTAGNIVGGAVFTGLALYLTYGLKKEQPKLREELHRVSDVQNDEQDIAATAI